MKALGARRRRKSRGGDYLAERGMREALTGQRNAPPNHNCFQRAPFLLRAGCRLLFQPSSVTINTPNLSRLGRLAWTIQPSHRTPAQTRSFLPFLCNLYKTPNPQNPGVTYDSKPPSTPKRAPPQQQEEIAGNFSQKRSR